MLKNSKLKNNVYCFLTLLTICLTATGQASPSKEVKRQNPRIKNIDTEYTYTVSTGKIIIQNSGPKGGGDIDGRRGYTDANGKNFGHAILWTRVINETTTPFTLTINFPADSFATPSPDIFPSPFPYVKLFIPPDTMTLEKESLYNYGVTGLKSFLDANFYKPARLQRTINPKEECAFYVVLLSNQIGGTVRAGLVLKDKELFYRFSILPHFNSELFPSGQIVFKKLKQ